MKAAYIAFSLLSVVLFLFSSEVNAQREIPVYETKNSFQEYDRREGEVRPPPELRGEADRGVPFRFREDMPTWLRVLVTIVFLATCGSFGIMFAERRKETVLFFLACAALLVFLGVMTTLCLGSG